MNRWRQGLAVLQERFGRSRGSSSGERVEPRLLGSASRVAGGGIADARAEGDSLGPYTQEHRTGDGDRPQRHGLRIAVAIIVLQAFTILSLSNTVEMLFPLKEWVPYILEKRSLDDAVVNVSPGTMSARVRDVVSEGEAARYVRTRHEVVPDIGEMDRRWGRKCAETGNLSGFELADLLCSYMFRHSTADVYSEFVRDLKEVEKFIDDGFGRKVRLLADPILKTRDKAGDVWEVRFAAIDYQPAKRTVSYRFAGEPETAVREGQVARERKFVAMLWVRFDESEAARRERHLNPFGFRVYKYHLAEIRE